VLAEDTTNGRRTYEALFRVLLQSLQRWNMYKIGVAASSKQWSICGRLQNVSNSGQEAT
jgi:hypothetical protein